MKRTILVTLILTIASIAYAASLELSVDGQIDGPENVTEVTVAPSGTITIDVWANTGGGANIFWLGIEPVGGTGEWLPETAQVFSEAPGNYVVEAYDSMWWLSRIEEPDPTDLGDEGKWYEIDFHCLGEGDVNIVLYNEGFDTVWDTILVHQEIPEPMTMSLLGLGGLLLRRRNKK